MLLVLFFNEFFDTHLGNIFQILLHTHSVVFSISIVQTVDLFARILVTFKAKFGFAFGSMINALTFHKQIFTSLISWPATNALASFQITDMRKIPTTYGTIHSARRNKLF
jgi:hypothetical protein